MNDAPRKRSPRAPSMALDEALERVLKAYERERLHPAPVDVVAQNIGYKNANSGAALTALASIGYFGLLERPKEGVLAVSKAVESYKFAPDESLRRTILLGFLKSPPLYGDLLDKYQDGLPSEANLRYELIQRGFAPVAAEVVLGAFQKSVVYAGYFENNKIETSPETPSRNAEKPFDDGPSLNNNNVFHNAASPSLSDGPEEQIDKIPVRLPGGRRAWLLIPLPFYEADKSRLKAQIDLILTQEEDGV